MWKPGPPRTPLEAAQVTRGYKHFDVPLSRRDCRRLVLNPEAVARHAFYPFLRRAIVRNKVRRNSSGKLESKAKVRDIRYAAHADAAIYAYYNFLLGELYEQRLHELGLQENVIAFRSLGKSNIHFAKEAFDWIEANTPCCALGFDVEDFFGSMNHIELKRAWSDLIKSPALPPDQYSVYRSLTRYASVDLINAREALGLSRSALEKLDRLCTPHEFREAIRGNGLIQVNASGKGIPQGSPISALLSNMYMLRFDVALKKQVEGMGGFYRRYCDDILVVVDREQVGLIESVVATQLRALSLGMQDEKTLECHFNPMADRPLQYLGLVFDGRRAMLRPSGIARYMLKMKRGVGQLKGAKVKKGGKPLHIQRRKRLVRQYTEHVPKGHRSYPSYAKQAALITGSEDIKRQLRRSRRRFKQFITD